MARNSKLFFEELKILVLVFFEEMRAKPLCQFLEGFLLPTTAFSQENVFELSIVLLNFEERPLTLKNVVKLLRTISNYR